MAELENNVKNEVKNLAKSTGKKLLMQLLPIVIILILLAGFFYYLTIDDGLWKDKENSPRAYTNNVKMKPSSDGSGYELTSDKEKILEEALLNAGYESEDIELMSLGEKIVNCGIAEDILKLAGKENDEIEEMTEEEMIEYFDSTSFKFDEVCTAVDLIFYLNPVYSDYLDNSDQLTYLLNAEIVTQYPNLKKEDDGKIYTTDEELLKDTNTYTDILDGVINFARPDYLGENTYLEYIEKSEYDALIESQNEEVFKKFTLDESQNILVAYWQERTVSLTSNDGNYGDLGFSFEPSGTTKSILSKSINYKSILNAKYNMPFNYLWAYMVVGRDYEFTSGLAKLAYDSNIVITIYDNLTTTTSTDTYNYTLQKNGQKTVALAIRTDAAATLPSSISSTVPVDVNEGNKSITYTVTDKVNTINVVLTKADVWIVEYSNEYTKDTIPEQTSNNSSNIEKTDPIRTKQYTQTSDLSSDSDAYNIWQNQKDYYVLDYIYHDYKYYAENLVLTNNTLTTGTKYEEGTPIVRVKANPEGGFLEEVYS